MRLPFCRAILRRLACVALFASSAVLTTATVIDQGLAVQRSGTNEYTVSWNAFLSQALVAQYASDLVSPSWTAVATTPTTVGSRRQVVFITTDPKTFFRLACTGTAGTDVPDDNFQDINCDGIDGDIASAIFVSPLGNDSSPGTITQPALTIGAAISKAGALGKTQIYAAAGTYSSTTVSLVNGISIYGGYNANDWTRSDANVTQLNASSSKAITATNITNGTTLDHLTIENSAATSGSTYGIFATNSAGLIIHKCTVRAGNGANATNGGDGSNGANGGNGGQGNPGCENSAGFCSSCSQPAGGLAGNSQCSRAGGVGGLPGLGSQNGFVGGTGQIGTPGGAGAPCSGSRACDGTPGSDGTNGAVGTNGVAGAGGAATFFATGYSPASGMDGAAGPSGNGGGGGGGGGGGTTDCDSYGSSGGGGGAGGCGGTRGTGGQSGGGSFAIYLWNSNATIEICTIITGNGGSGGSGGTGGTGGIGGSGGAGGPYGGSSSQDDGGDGAAGGKGGNGGRGGHGGGGAGAPSIGILISGGSSPQMSSLTFNIGSGGAGGTSMGNAGPIGLAQNTYTVP